MNVKKWMAGATAAFFAAASLSFPLPGAGTASFVEAAASGSYPELSIDKMELTVSEAAGATVSLDVYLDSPGLSGFAMVLQYDDRLSGAAIQILDLKLGRAVSITEDNYIAISWAESKSYTFDEAIFRITVTLPEDVQPGDFFEVEYLPVSPSGVSCEWSDHFAGKRYDATSVNGGIRIAEDENWVPDTTEPTEPTTEPTEPDTDAEEPAEIPKLFIEQKTLTVSEAAGATVSLDVHLDSPGLSGFIMALQYDDRLSGAAIKTLDSRLGRAVSIIESYGKMSIGKK